MFCPSQFKLCYVIFILYYVSELEIVFISFYGDFIDWGCFSCLSFASIVLYILNHEHFHTVSPFSCARGSPKRQILYEKAGHFQVFLSSFPQSLSYLLYEKYSTCCMIWHQTEVISFTTIFGRYLI